MGDRVSISFRKGNVESVALFDHWGGMDRVADAQAFAAQLKGHPLPRRTWRPLDRLEPCTVMIEYIRHALEDVPIGESDLYLGDMKDPMRGDNSDNGHHVISLDADSTDEKG